MTLADVAAVRDELARCRRQIDLALGRSLQLLDRLETEMRARQPDERLTVAERASLGAEP